MCLNYVSVKSGTAQGQFPCLSIWEKQDGCGGSPASLFNSPDSHPPEVSESLYNKGSLGLSDALDWLTRRGHEVQYSWRTYGILAGVLALSFLLAWALPTTDILRGIYGLPGIGALLYALYQVFRDHAAHERALALQRDQQHFVLGVTSHMAKVAFDKHAEFCEKYIGRMQSGLSELFARGPSSQCLILASELADIRLSFRAWLMSDLQEKILPFEEALRKVGGRSISLEGFKDEKQRARVLDEIYDVFDKIIGLPGQGKEIDKRVAPGRIMDHLQDLLGVKELCVLRSTLINEAIKTLERKN